MRCIDSIFIRNFRTHRKLKIKFSPTVTCITGESDKGKSNVIRAIRWVALNRPTGTSYIRWGKGQAKVRLSILRHATCRIRGKKRNTYRLDEQSFEGFGNDVPKPISDLLRMSDVNFQLQHDPHFWFSLSPGEVSRQLNKIVSLDVIDKTLSNINASINKAKTEVEVCKDRLEDAKDRRKSLQHVKEMKTDIEHLIQLQQKRDRAERKAGKLNGLIETIREYKLRMRKRRQTTQQARMELDKLDRMESVWKDADLRLCTIDEFIDQMHYRRRNLQTSQHQLKIAQDRLEKSRGNRCPLCGKKRTLSKPK